MDEKEYIVATFQMLKKIQGKYFWKKIYTYVKVVLEQQEN